MIRISVWGFVALMIIGVGLSTAAAVTGFGPEWVKGFERSFSK